MIWCKANKQEPTIKSQEPVSKSQDRVYHKIYFSHTWFLILESWFLVFGSLSWAHAIIHFISKGENQNADA
jgi:hypothetical protein